MRMRRDKDKAKKNYKQTLRSLSVLAPLRAAFPFLVPVLGLEWDASHAWNAGNLPKQYFS
jgi:hypothetical protein